MPDTEAGSSDPNGEGPELRDMVMVMLTYIQ